MPSNLMSFGISSIFWTGSIYGTTSLLEDGASSFFAVSNSTSFPRTCSMPWFSAIVPEKHKQPLYSQLSSSFCYFLEPIQKHTEHQSKQQNSLALFFFLTAHRAPIQKLLEAIRLK